MSEMRKLMKLTEAAGFDAPMQDDTMITDVLAGLKQVKASHSTIYELFWPLSAVAIDWIVRGRILTPVQFIGGAILIVSIILLTREQQKHNGKTNKKRT